MNALMTLAQVASWLAGAKPVAWPDEPTLALARVHSDSRSLQAGDLFIALRGEHFDGNNFLAQAKAAGALAAICQGENAAALLKQARLPGLVVPDSRLALAQLATKYRAQFNLPLIAVTGSNGKTTVTQMIGAILRAWHGAAALATQGNFNNDIGLPLSVLRLRPEHRAAVLELGMNQRGEIANLASIAQPTVALVNNAQREHLEFMHTVAAVAQENGAVITALADNGVAVFPADDAFSTLWGNLAGQRRQMRFALDAATKAEVFMLQAHWQDAAWQVSASTPLGELHYRLPIAGRHNVKNSLAAAAGALASGAPLDAIKQGLSTFAPVAGRSRTLQLHQPNGTVMTLVDDSYNANPDSMAAAIDMLASLPAPRLLVLGDMAEVGAQSLAAHIEVLAQAKQQNIDQILVTGAQFAQAALEVPSVKVHQQMTELQNAVLAAATQTRSVLVKGSRCMAMERVVAVLVNSAPQQEVAQC